MAAPVTLTPQLNGLGLPALRYGGQSYFSSKNAYDCAWSDLMMTLFTPIGGRAMSRSFGSALQQQLFDPVTVAQANIVSYVVNQAAQKWCPHVQVLQVLSVVQGQRISLGVIFALTSDRTKTEQRSVLIPKSQIIQLLSQANQ